MAGLELGRYRLVLRPLQPLALSEYKGATFRGGFGTVFRRVACACGSGATVHQQRCLYAQVFETPQREDLPALPRTAHLPHPFVLEPPLETQRVYTPADRLTVHLILMGQALEWLPYFVFTFDELGRVGIGQNRGRYQVDEVCSVNGADTTVVFSGSTRRFLGQGQRVTFEELWQPDEAVQVAEVEFLTYARVMGKGHLRSSVDFPLLFGALLRRIALLMYAHGDGGTLPLPSGCSIDALSVLRYFYDRSAQQPDARQAIRDAYRLAEQVVMAREGLHWEEWERYSDAPGDTYEARWSLGHRMLYWASRTVSALPSRGRVHPCGEKYHLWSGADGSAPVVERSLQLLLYARMAVQEWPIIP